MWSTRNKLFIFTKKSEFQNPAALNGKRKIWTVKNGDEVSICEKTKTKLSYHMSWNKKNNVQKIKKKV